MTLSGWYRLSKRHVWHLFETWSANEFMLIPACQREFFITKRYKDHLKQRADLPPDAKLCRGCSASPRAA